jgi:hypothetical protein
MTVNKNIVSQQDTVNEVLSHRQFCRAKLGNAVRRNGRCAERPMEDLPHGQHVALHRTRSPSRTYGGIVKLLTVLPSPCHNTRNHTPRRPSQSEERPPA